MSAEIERPFGRHRLVLATTAAAVSTAGGDVPAQELVYFGGPLTGPGYDFHSLAGVRGLSQRIEWRLPVRFVSIPLGRFGRAPAGATLAPFVHGVHIGGRPEELGPGPEGFHPAAGIGMLALFDLLRFDVAHGLRDGRWTFSVDVSRDFWPVL
jgi:hemolysin activation/secretion protein